MAYQVEAYYRNLSDPEAFPMYLDGCIGNVCWVCNPQEARQFRTERAASALASWVNADPDPFRLSCKVVSLNI